MLSRILLGLLTGLCVHTEGVWTYVKLPNGIAVCWGVTTASMECTKTGMGGYYEAEGAEQAFPAGLFVNTPVGTGLAYSAGTYATLGQSRPKNKDVFYWNVVSADQTRQIYIAHLFAIGRWK